MKTMLISILSLSAMLSTAKPAAREADFYVKKDSWTATMLATRDRYQALIDTAPVREGTRSECAGFP